MGHLSAYLEFVDSTRLAFPFEQIYQRLPAFLSSHQSDFVWSVVLLHEVLHRQGLLHHPGLE